MAEFVLDNPRVFPNGTSVGAYPASNWTVPVPSGKPVGTATQTVTVASDKASFTTLTENVLYWAVGEVADDEYRYVSFLVPATEGGEEEEGEGGTSGVRPEKYGAKGDLAYVADAAVESGETTLTSESAGFTAADVGKVINVRGAGTTEHAGMLTTTIEAVTDTETITLADAASATVMAKVAIYGTDDAEAFREAVAAVFEAGTADGTNAGILDVAGQYMIAGEPDTGGDNEGNAQIPLPKIDSRLAKFRFTLRCPGRGAPLQHWNQTTPQIAGPTLFSPLVAAEVDGTYKAASVIGGPTAVSTDPHGGDYFSNMLFATEGSLTIILPRKPNHIGIDLRQVAECSIDELSIIANASSAEMWEDVTGNNFNSGCNGLRLPQNFNNDLADVRSLSVEGLPWGVAIGEHFNIGRLAGVYCNQIAYSGPLGSATLHGGWVGYFSAEYSRTIWVAEGDEGAKFPITIARLDVEEIQSTMFVDTNNCLRGTVNYAEQGSTAPTKSGAEHLEITDNNNAE